MKRKKPFDTIKVGNAVVNIYHRVRLDKRNGGEYHKYEVADYTNGKGNRKMRSFSDLKDADKEARRIATLLSNGEATAAQIKGKDAAEVGRALEKLRPTGASLIAACDRYAECFKILGGDRMLEAAKDYARRHPVKRQPHTVKAVAAELVELKRKRGKSNRYIEQLEWMLDKFGETFARDVATITTAEIQSWLDGMDASARTVKNFRDSANTLFKYAEARGYIARGDNPVTATEKGDKDSGKRIEIYTPAEVQRLLSATPESFRPLIALQAFAGLRSAEVMRLNWQDIKLERGHIEIGSHIAKTASRRLVPITANLAQWLTDYADKKGKVWPSGSGSIFYKTQEATAAATEIKADVEKKIEAMKPVTWKQNALRHSFISYRVADTADVARVALESGNSPAMIFANYRELVTPEDAKTWFAIAPEQPGNVISMKGRTA
jgi:integrase